MDRHNQVAGIVYRNICGTSASRLTNKLLANQLDIVVVDKEQKIDDRCGDPS